MTDIYGNIYEYDPRNEDQAADRDEPRSDKWNDPEEADLDTIEWLY
ncbi:MAG: hypothetical protein L0229_20360 [Blastocatellia bacterium]|nr:hypothetical protein [Blastocatellia bacterium]